MNDFTNYRREDFLADESFVNYLLEKSIDDVQFWKQWIIENPQCNAEVEEARSLFFILRQDAAPTQVSDISRQYSKLRALLNNNRLGETEAAGVLHKEKNGTEIISFKKVLLYVSGIAAIFIIAASLWIIFGPSANSGTKEAYSVFAQTENNTKQVTLPDGSKVQLNTNSSVKIAGNYNTENRKVLLTGSAFFEVQKDASKPFIVTAGIVKTTAIGTSFYIYGLSNKATSVSLLKGKVRVDEHGNHVELIPGEKATYTLEAGLVKSSFNTKQFLLWRDGEVGFEHANWNEIKGFIEAYFNKEVLVKGMVPKFNFTGNFDAQKIETLLDVLNFTYNAEYKLDGQQVIITFKN